MRAAPIRKALLDHPALEQIRVERNQLAIGYQRKSLAEAVYVLREGCIRVPAHLLTVAHLPSIPLCGPAVVAIVNGPGSSDVEATVEINSEWNGAWPSPRWLHLQLARLSSPR